MKKALKKIHCSHRMRLPVYGSFNNGNFDKWFWACGCYYDTPRKDGLDWGHFPVCTGRNCPKKHPELIASERAKNLM